MMKTKRR